MCNSNAQKKCNSNNYLEVIKKKCKIINNLAAGRASQISRVCLCVSKRKPERKKKVIVGEKEKQNKGVFRHTHPLNPQNSDEARYR